MAGVAAFFTSTAAWAVAGRPTDWQINFQDAVTPVMEDIISFDNYLLWIITAVSVFVLILLLVVMLKFNARANPVPSKTTHHVGIEVAWTIIPVLILVAIAIPSFRLLYLQRTIPEADMTIKAIGYQWYWGYEYSDLEDVAFESVMLTKEEVKAKGLPSSVYLLETDTEIVVPVNKTIRLQVTAEDVIHAWTIPSFGVKIDAVPGRLNEAWFKATEVGTYYGQCSELCGINHAFMPIRVRVVTQDEFDAWTVWAKDEYASIETSVKFADADTVKAAVAR
ncbi:MAG: cytochrome c oxidase subunit 2 [Parvibaculaceae bacterium]|jgi:cytochrome c oxidase subunit 2|nr:cytochrome c oxidase subunit II [Parvibaculaceae bacterium]|tara:strand:- start:43 stop:879 length:837 start_codon:yes stop_codon:yes gene_type:complete